MLLQLKHSGFVWRTLCPVHRSAAHSPRCVYIIPLVGPAEAEAETKSGYERNYRQMVSRIPTTFRGNW